MVYENVWLPVPVCVQVTVIDDVPEVGLIVSYAPNAWVGAATVQLSADHATEGTSIVQDAAIPASSALDVRIRLRTASFSMRRINSASGTRRARGAAADPG